MKPQLRTLSPIDGRCYLERELADAVAVDAALDAARRAQADWQRVPLASTLSRVGFEPLTRPKSFHSRITL